VSSPQAQVLIKETLQQVWDLKSARAASFAASAAAATTHAEGKASEGDGPSGAVRRNSIVL
jgi:hypothetical protein